MKPHVEPREIKSVAAGGVVLVAGDRSAGERLTQPGALFRRDLFFQFRRKDDRQRLGVAFAVKGVYGVGVTVGVGDVGGLMS